MTSCDIVLIGIGGQGVVPLVRLAARDSARCLEKNRVRPILLLGTGRCALDYM